MKLNYKRTILVGFAFFLISAFWQAYDAIVPLILENHYGLTPDWSGAVMSVDNVLAVFLLPLFGAFSDKINSRWGKRTPFIFIGAILAVIFFITLSFADNAQMSTVMSTDIPARYNEAKITRENAYDALSEALRNRDSAAADMWRAEIESIDAIFLAITADALAITASKVAPFVCFVVLLLILLFSMAIFRSPAVALMPDVTVKPLRSKGNAIINLMGTAGGIIVLVLGLIFNTKQVYMNYTWYIMCVCAVMIVGLIIFLVTVKEKKWSEEMQLESLKLEREEKKSEDSPARKLSKEETTSLILILASVALWYIGYNSVTSKYSVYATRELGFDYNLTLIIAQAAAVVSYIPVGILSSKIGRKKSILIGVATLATAFFLGNFITPTKD